MSLALRNMVNISGEHASSLSKPLSSVTSGKTAVVKQCLPNANLGMGVDFKRAGAGSSLLAAGSPGRRRRRGGEGPFLQTFQADSRPLLDLPAPGGWESLTAE